MEMDTQHACVYSLWTHTHIHIRTSRYMHMPHTNSLFLSALATDTSHGRGQYACKQTLHFSVMCALSMLFLRMLTCVVRICSCPSPLPLACYRRVQLERKCWLPSIVMWQSMPGCLVPSRSGRGSVGTCVCVSLTVSVCLSVCLSVSVYLSV